MRSDSPLPYTLAVSKKRTPRSSARSTMRRASAAGVRLPKFIVPRESTGWCARPSGRGVSQGAREGGKCS